MSTATANLVVKARADTRGAARNMDRLKAVGQGLTRVIGALGVAAGAVGVALVAMGREALAQEEVFTRLEDSLQRAGIAYDDVSGRLSEFMAQQQRVTRFGDDQTAAAMANIARLTQSMGPTVAQLEEMTALTQDIAEATGRDLDRTAEYVARAFAGTTEGLDRLLPAHREYLQELGKMEDSAERAAAVMGLLEAEFGGVAEAIPETTLAIARLQNGLGDVREAIGDAALEGIQASGAFDSLADAADVLAAALNPASGEATALGEAVQGMAATAGNAIIALSRLVVETFIDLRQESLRLEGFLERGRAERTSEDIQALESILEGGRAGTAIGRGYTGMLGGLPRIASSTLGSRAEGTLSDIEIARIAATESREQIQARIDRLRGLQEVSQYAADQNSQAIAELDAALAEFNAALSGGMGGAAATPEEQPAGQRSLALTQSAISRFRGILTPDESDDDGGGTSSAGEELDLAMLKAAEAKDEYDGLANKVAFARDEIEAATAATIGLVDAFGALASTGPEYVLERMAMASERVADGMEKFKQTTQDANLAQAEAIKGMADRLNGIRDGALASFITASAEGFGTIAIEGGNAGKMLAKSTLKSIGQMASAMGQMFILSGIAGQAVPFLGMKLTGPVAIAAGAKLIALGAGLGAAAGRMGGGGGGGGRGPTGVGESFEQSISRPQITRQDFAGVTIVTEDDKTINRLTRLTDRSRETGVTRNVL